MKPAHATLKAVCRLSSLISTGGGKVIACRMSFVIGSLRAFVDGKKVDPESYEISRSFHRCRCQNDRTII